MNDIKSEHQDQDIDLKIIFNVLWKNKLIILLITIFFGVGSIFYALSLPNIYTSSALLQLKSDEGNSSSLGSRYGGLASLAGVSLPTGGNEKGSYIIETIKSREFIQHLITFDGVMENLMASKKYDHISTKIIYDENLFDESTKKWRLDNSSNKSLKPSYLMVKDVYDELVDIQQDNDSGFISINFSHTSPYFAYYFTDLIINQLNLVAKTRDFNEATNALIFLENRLLVTINNETKTVINNLMSAQLQKIMLSSLDDDYLLRSIDSPFIPEIKSSPSRSLVCISITLLGLILSLILVTIKHLFSKEERYES